MGSRISGSDQDPPDVPEFVASPWEDNSVDLPEITEESERVRAVWVEEDGLIHSDGDGKRRVDISVAVVVTDRRILFAPRGDDAGAPSGAHSLPYTELASVDVTEPTLALTTAGGVTWAVPLPADRPAGMEPVLAHLRWIGRLRHRVGQCGEDVDGAADAIREHAHALDWERARSTYERTRRQLDDLIRDVQLVDPVDQSHLAPELTDMERQLELAHARLRIERAKSALALGRHLIENEEYGRAREHLREAQRYYDLAHESSDAVERADAFQFGPQRALQNDLENLGWEIETVAAEPIRRAHEAKVQAQFADDAESSLERWETAFRLYGDVLTLEWDDDGRNFAGDPESVRAERAETASRIVDLRDDIAREEWDEGALSHQDGDSKHALHHCSSAVDHLERARELAVEFVPSSVSTIDARLERMTAVVDELAAEVDEDTSRGEASIQGAYSGQSTPPSEDDTRGDDPRKRREESTSSADDSPLERTDTTAPDPDDVPSIEELNDIDTHHEIATSLDDGGPLSRGPGAADTDDDSERGTVEPNGAPASSTTDSDAAGENGTEAGPDGETQ